MSDTNQFGKGLVPFSLPKLGSGLLGNKGVIIAIVIVIGVILLYNMLFVYVEPGEVALEASISLCGLTHYNGARTRIPPVVHAGGCDPHSHRLPRKQR